MLDAPLVTPRGYCHSESRANIARVLVGICSTALVLAACGDPISVLNPADMVLHVVSGDSQVGVPFEELPEPIVVQVVDTANNQPVVNQVINFRVVEGGGSVFAGVAHTNEEGIAQEYWTLGGAGPQLLEARAVTGEGEKVIFGTFSATAVEPFDSIPSVVQCLNTVPTWRPHGDCEYGITWVDSSVTASFRVVNADSVPLPNVLVRFEVDTTVNGTMFQLGTVTPDSARTDTAGVVTATWTLGPYPGDNRLLVSAYGPDSTATIDAWAYGAAHPPPPDSVPAFIRCFMPGGWWRYDGECDYGPVPVDSAISVSFQVAARDSIPLPNTWMFFAVDTVAIGNYVQGGSVTPDSVLTDSLGMAITSWTLGQSAGRNRLVVSAVGAGVTVTEVMVATGVPESIPIDSVPALIQCQDYHGTWRTEGLCAYYSVPEGTTFPALFRVTNRDTLPLPNVAMEFEITHGDGVVTPVSATTDSLGQVTVQWTVGSYNVGQQLTARVPEWQLEVSVRVGVQMPQPEKIWWDNPYGGDWTKTSNWTAGRVPRLGDTVVVSLGGDYTILAESDSTIAMGSFEIGTPDTTTTQTLYIDRTEFHVDWFGGVHPSAVIQVDSGGAYVGPGLVFVLGGEVRLTGGSWETNTRVDSGAFVFDGWQPKSLVDATIVGYGGEIVWRSMDTLLVLQDSAAMYLLGDADLVLEDTLTIVGGFLSEALVVDSTASLVFTADADQPNFLQMSGTNVYIGGEIAIETSLEPASGTVFDLVRLVGGATLTGVPTLVTAGYTLSVNPEEGVGLRVVKN